VVRTSLHARHLLATAARIAARCRFRATSRRLSRTLPRRSPGSRRPPRTDGHEGKGKEFDFVILPFLSTENFGDDQESRQLLYVSLSRARKRILVRVASGEVPSICERIGLV
jgi:hypothetical protein